MKLLLGDCLERMKEIPSGSVDMVMADLPYGTTACKWDSVIPMEPLWDQYFRLCKGAIVLTSSQPFTSVLVQSNLKDFRYEIIWVKHQATNPSFAKHGILKVHENILVFGKEKIIYNPQKDFGKIYSQFHSRMGKKVGEAHGDIISAHKGNPDGSLFPVSFLYFRGNSGSGNEDCGNLHPTQKPVALMEYLIKTYTNPGMTVLDNTMGSGTTGVACMNTGREFIGIERDPNYFAIAEKRILEAAMNDPAF